MMDVFVYKLVDLQTGETSTDTFMSITSCDELYDCDRLLASLSFLNPSPQLSPCRPFPVIYGWCPFATPTSSVFICSYSCL